MNLWPVEHFFPPFFFHISIESALIWKKRGKKAVLFSGSTSYEIHILVINVLGFFSSKHRFKSIWSETIFFIPYTY